MALRVTTIRERPDLLPIVSEWLWREWWEQRGKTCSETAAVYAAGNADRGAPQTFVLLENERAVGTATMARQDLEERPDLTPWLAGVFVIPDRRGRGYVQHLLAAFERACRTCAVDVAWLYTNTAERLYLGAGWEAVEIIQRPGKRPVTLMRRVFADGSDTSS